MEKDSSSYDDLSKYLEKKLHDLEEVGPLQYIEDKDLLDSIVGN